MTTADDTHSNVFEKTMVEYNRVDERMADLKDKIANIPQTEEFMMKCEILYLKLSVEQKLAGLRNLHAMRVKDFKRAFKDDPDAIIRGMPTFDKIEQEMEQRMHYDDSECDWDKYFLNRGFESYQIYHLLIKY